VQLDRAVVAACRAADALLVVPALTVELRMTSAPSSTMALPPSSAAPPVERTIVAMPKFANAPLPQWAMPATEQLVSVIVP
jgi:hypothetical protein